jgi:hypothetical protein
VHLATFRTTRAGIPVVLDAVAKVGMGFATPVAVTPVTPLQPLPNARARGVGGEGLGLQSAAICHPAPPECVSAQSTLHVAGPLRPPPWVPGYVQHGTGL